MLGALEQREAGCKARLGLPAANEVRRCPRSRCLAFSWTKYAERSVRVNLPSFGSRDFTSCSQSLEVHRTSKLEPKKAHHRHVTMVAVVTAAVAVIDLPSFALQRLAHTSFEL